MRRLVHRPGPSHPEDVLAGEVLAGEVEEPNQPVVLAPAPLRRIIFVIQAERGLPIPVPGCLVPARSKGNQSGLYHVPDGSYYDVTNPEECFATAEDAEAAGYEASSR